MQQKQSRINDFKVGAMGVADEEERRRLGIHCGFDGDEVVAVIPADLEISWVNWGPGCVLIEVPGFPRHVVLAAAHRRRAVYVIGHVDEPGMRRAIVKLCADDDLASLRLVTPTRVECLILGHETQEALGDLLRRTERKEPDSFESRLPPAALLEQLPDLFSEQVAEGGRYLHPARTTPGRCRPHCQTRHSPGTKSRMQRWAIARSFLCCLWSGPRAIWQEHSSTLRFGAMAGVDQILRRGGGHGSDLQPWPNRQSRPLQRWTRGALKIAPPC